MIKEFFGIMPDFSHREIKPKNDEEMLDITPDIVPEGEDYEKVHRNR